MSENKSTYRGFTEAQAKAHAKYMEKFVEIKTRMTPEKRQLIKDHAAAVGESVSQYVNNAIDLRIQSGE